MRIITGALLLAALTLTGCASTASVEPEYSCDDIKAAKDERSDAGVKALESIQPSDARRNEKILSGLTLALAANHLVVDHPECFTPGEVADSKANIAVYESRLPTS